MKTTSHVNLLIRAYASLFLFFLNGKFDSLKLFLFTVIFSVSLIVTLLVEKGDLSMIETALDYERPSTVYGLAPDSNYEPIAEFYKFSRIPISLATLQEKVATSPGSTLKVVDAFLSTEDSGFYSHKGVDVRGIFRATAVNIVAGKIKEGASTITQQVARLKFLSNTRSYARKAREAWLAILMERKFDKQIILETYLNEIPLGHGTLGAAAASKFYFRKTLEELSWGEAALLASLTTRPKDFSPLVNPILSSKKVRVVFMKLIEAGKLSVKEAEEEYRKFTSYYKKLNRSPNDSAFSDRLNRFPYFTEYIRRQLEADKSLQKDIYTGGYKIYTTLNIHHQKAAESYMFPALANQTKASVFGKIQNPDIFDARYGNSFDIISLVNDLPEFKVKVQRGEKQFLSTYHFSMRDHFTALNNIMGSSAIGEAIDEDFLRGDTEDHSMQVEGALISMRPNTGHITAIIGGSGFRSDNQQIRAIQALRQPGSSFKPLVYAAAIDYSGRNPSKNPDENVTASSLFLDSPMSYLSADGDEWNPVNYSESYGGFMRLRSAVETSRNMVALRVLDQTGLSKLYPTIVDLLPTGRDIPRNISIALGTYEVTPLELTRAYSVFVSGGKEVHPISILYITDTKDKMVIDYREVHEKLVRKQIISKEASYIITSLLRSVVLRGTGKAVINYGLNRKAAGKTGTTNNFRDAWFVGFTPELVTGVWLGYDLGTLSLGKGMAGGVIAAPLWGKYMAKALENEPKAKYNFGSLRLVKKPTCTQSGKLKGSLCRKTYLEYFIQGTEPGICDFHRGSIPSFTPTDSDDPKDAKDKADTKSKTEPKKPVPKVDEELFKGDDKIE
jgi:penicillin-binding protein 1A